VVLAREHVVHRAAHVAVAQRQDHAADVEQTVVSDAHVAANDTLLDGPVDHRQQDAPVRPVDVEDPRVGCVGTVAQRLPPPRVVDGRGEVVRDDVDDEPEAAAVRVGGELAQPVGAAELVADARGVDHVVAVHAPGDRGRDGGEVHVRHAEVVEVPEDRARVREREARVELQAVRRDRRAHDWRCSTSTPQGPTRSVASPSDSTSPPLARSPSVSPASTRHRLRRSGARTSTASSPKWRTSAPRSSPARRCTTSVRASGCVDTSHADGSRRANAGTDARTSRSVRNHALIASASGDERPRCNTADRNVSSLCGSGGSPSHPKPANSSARPRRTASTNCGSEWLTKYGNGARSPYSSPWNTSGTNGDRSTAAAARRDASAGREADRRSPAIRLPTWSWFCANT